MKARNYFRALVCSWGSAFNYDDKEIYSSKTVRMRSGFGYKTSAKNESLVSVNVDKLTVTGDIIAFTVDKLTLTVDKLTLTGDKFAFTVDKSSRNRDQ